MKEVSYPFKEGKSGINFDTLSHTTEPTMTHGESGKRLLYTKTNNELSIVDSIDPALRLMANVEKGELSLDLHTVSAICNGRHPDMFASSFIGIAIRHFSSCGNDIQTCKCCWEPGSVNYRDFMAVYRTSDDKCEAARSTWSSDAIGKYGFTEIDEDAVQIIDESEDDAGVIVTFKKSDVN